MFFELEIEMFENENVPNHLIVEMVDGIEWWIGWIWKRTGYCWWYSPDHLAIGHVKLICVYQKSLRKLCFPCCRNLTSFAGQMEPHFGLVIWSFLHVGSKLSLQISQVPPTGECKCWSGEVRAIGASAMFYIFTFHLVKPLSRQKPICPWFPSPDNHQTMVYICLIFRRCVEAGKSM